MKNIVTTVLATLAVAACLVGCEPTVELDDYGLPTEASMRAVEDSLDNSEPTEEERRAFGVALTFSKTADLEGFTASELIEEGERLIANADDRARLEAETRLEAEKSSLRGIAQALELYKLDNRHYPATEQGLEALVTKPSGFPEAKNWGPEPYLRKYPLDQYENEYFYLSEGRGFELKALGADGVEGGEGADADVGVASAR